MDCEAKTERSVYPDQHLGVRMIAEESPYDNKIRPITIRQLGYGYTIEVGCQTLAIESASTLIAKLSEYILNPKETEKKYNDKKLF